MYTREDQPQTTENQNIKYSGIKQKFANDTDVSKNIGTDCSYTHAWVWQNVIVIFILHVFGIYGWFLIVTGAASIKTFLWSLFIGYIGGQGIGIGAHRLFTHKSFKAKSVLRFVLILMQTVAGQYSMFTWVRIHRLHHQYSETDGDPHNSNRGFFFSHVGWLMMKKHPYVIELGRKIDMSDLEADWMIMLQKKYYVLLYVIFGILFPVMVPIYYFDESWWNSLLVAYFTRQATSLNFTSLVNSFAHIYGFRPYDKNLKATESWFVSMVTLGEGWHNYHHAFPWDYKAAEHFRHFNFTARVIRFLERVGLVYDLKAASPDMVKNRIVRAGDGSHYLLSDELKNAVTALGPSW